MAVSAAVLVKLKDTSEHNCKLAIVSHERVS